MLILVLRDGGELTTGKSSSARGTPFKLPVKTAFLSSGLVTFETTGVSPAPILPESVGLLPNCGITLLSTRAGFFAANHETG